MKTQNLISFLTIACLLATGLFCSAQQTTNTTNSSVAVAERIWGPETNGLRLSLSLAKANYVKGEPIWAKIFIRNVGQTDKEVRETLQISDFRFTILDSAGKQVPLTDYGKKWESRSLIQVWNNVRVLKPGNELSNEHQLNEIWDMSQPGKYRVTAVRPVSWDNWKELRAKGVPLKDCFAYVTSTPVEIEVVPK